MKEKTFKDLGLDKGDEYLEKIAEEYDLGELFDILAGKQEDGEEKIRGEKAENGRKTSREE